MHPRAMLIVAVAGVCWAAGLLLIQQHYAPRLRANQDGSFTVLYYNTWQGRVTWETDRSADFVSRTKARQELDRWTKANEDN